MAGSPDDSGTSSQIEVDSGLERRAVDSCNDLGMDGTRDESVLATFLPCLKFFLGQTPGPSGKPLSSQRYSPGSESQEHSAWDSP